MAGFDGVTFKDAWAIGVDLLGSVFASEDKVVKGDRGGEPRSLADLLAEYRIPSSADSVDAPRWTVAEMVDRAATALQLAQDHAEGPADDLAVADGWCTLIDKCGRYGIGC